MSWNPADLETAPFTIYIRRNNLTIVVRLSGKLYNIYADDWIIIIGNKIHLYKYVSTAFRVRRGDIPSSYDDDSSTIKTSVQRGRYIPSVPYAYKSGLRRNRDKKFRKKKKWRSFRHNIVVRAYTTGIARIVHEKKRRFDFICSNTILYGQNLILLIFFFSLFFRQYIISIQCGIVFTLHL